MGLSIHYRIKFSGSYAEANAFVYKLHAAAQSFGAGEVKPVQVSADNETTLSSASTSWVLEAGEPTPVEAIELVAFVLLPGEGCEPAPFGLARYPAFVSTDGRKIKTNLDEDWHWASHVKTQYASNPAHGGIQNFLQCHLTICALLEKAKGFGAEVTVDDESGFWEHRNVKRLVQAVEKMNILMAGLAGTMKDADTEGKAGGAIQNFNDFERLEAQAMADPKLAKSLKQAVQQIKNHS